MLGVAPDVALCVHKVLSDGGGGSYADVVKSLDEIVAFNANNSDSPILVTNNSYGSRGDPGTTVRQAFESSAKAGVIHIAAAGNEGNCGGNNDSVGYPARYASVVAVAATNQNDNRPCFSSTGPDVELSAPGVSIYSTVPGGYGTASGTSMASPHVAGVAALVFAADSSLINTQVRDILQQTAKDIGPSHRYGHGLVQAHHAVAAALNGGGTDDGGDEEDATGTITGQVTDTENSAIAGATVSVEGTDLFATTDEQGEYTINNVPVDTYSVTASADGYIAQTDSGVTVAEEEATTVNFALEPEGDDEPPPPAEGTVTVSSVEYSTHGGRTNDRHLTVTLTVEDEDGNGVSDASVSIDLFHGGSLYGSATGTTNGNGTVSFSANNAPSGTYTTEVTDVDADGLEWDEVTPENSFEK